MTHDGNKKAGPELADTAEKLGVAKRLYETYEEKRRFPRVPLRCPGLIVMGDRRHCVIVHNVSPEGAQIRCKRDVAAALNPDGRRIEAGAEPQVELISTLPAEYGGGLLKTKCRMWYFSLVPDNEVAFGLRFDGLSETGTGALNELLRAALEPEPDDPA